MTYTLFTVSTIQYRDVFEGLFFFKLRKKMILTSRHIFHCMIIYSFAITTVPISCEIRLT
jgi:hypothetical protein